MTKRMSPSDRAKLVYELLCHKVKEARENFLTLEEVKEMIIDTGLNPNSKSSINNTLDEMVNQYLTEIGSINIIVDDEPQKVPTYMIKENA